MASKFNRVYRLEIQANDGTTVIIDSTQAPLTLNFSIRQVIASTAGSATFRIYNLSLQSRNRVYKDILNPWAFRYIAFYAGYEGQLPLPLVFSGNILEAKSFREENTTEFITEIRAQQFAWPMVNVQAQNNFSGTMVTQNQVISQLINDLTSQTNKIAGKEVLTKGIVSETQFIDTYPKYSYQGNSWNKLTELTQGLNFIYNGKINIIGDLEYTPADLIILDSSTGLLSPPNKSENILSLQLLFEPRLALGSKVRLNSTDNPLFNGDYKVTGIDHIGTISGAVGGKCRTTVYLILPIFQIARLAAALSVLTNG